jgi:hypothetical protein
VLASVIAEVFLAISATAASRAVCSALVATEPFKEAML